MAVVAGLYAVPPLESCSQEDHTGQRWTAWDVRCVCACSECEEEVVRLCVVLYDGGSMKRMVGA